MTLRVSWAQALAWRMRRQLLAHVDERQGDGIDAVVMTALQRHRGLLGG